MTSALHLPPVLVLEDSDEDYDTVQEAAKKAGITHPLHRAVTGDQCLALLRGANAFHPAIILLDLNTPGTDGRQVLVDIKRDQNLRHLPVVVHTTSANPRDIQHCYDMGANAYHVKPLRYTEHLAQLSELFKYWLASVLLADEIGDSS